ncbi:uncharacterized protein LOC143532743 [Bidens hawaiensis]|uniref:uncharacterized protein LOC143532743 n=1 Tax=Bidens hawaiensis TaxID=980011 RepID=UPI00404A5A33
MAEVQGKYTVDTEFKPNLVDEWFEEGSCWWTSQEVVPKSNPLKVTLESSIVILNLDDKEILVEEESTVDQNVTVTVTEQDERETVLEEVHEEVAPSHVTGCHDGIQNVEAQQTNKVDVGVRMKFMQSSGDLNERTNRGVEFEREHASSEDGRIALSTMIVGYEVEKAKVVSYLKPGDAVLNNGNLETSSFVTRKKKPGGRVMKSNPRIKLKEVRALQGVKDLGGTMKVGIERECKTWSNPNLKDPNG